MGGDVGSPQNFMAKQRKRLMAKQRNILGNTILGVMTLGFYVPYAAMKMATGLSLSNAIPPATKVKGHKAVSKFNKRFEVTSWAKGSHVTMTTAEESVIAMLRNELEYRNRMKQRPTRIRIIELD